MTPDLTEVESRLYGADLDAFVRERSAAAKELRGEGKRTEAAAVAKLPKPSVTAWMVNRVAREEPDLVAGLLDAGARLREVQLGAGSAGDLRAAAEDQDAALRAVMRGIEKIAAKRGSAATLDRARETLHAAALDADLAEQVRRGVLVREQRAVGFPAGIAIPASAGARARRSAPRRSEPRSPASRRRARSRGTRSRRNGWSVPPRPHRGRRRRSRAPTPSWSNRGTHSTVPPESSTVPARPSATWNGAPTSCGARSIAPRGPTPRRRRMRSRRSSASARSSPR